MGSSLRDGASRSLPGRVPDQPVHGPRPAARSGPRPARSGTAWSPRSAPLGGEVEVIEQRADAPDMVYAMNLGFVVEPAEGRFVTSSAGHVVLSHMRYAERRMETSSAATWFAGRGFTTSYVGRDGVGAHLEAGDAFAWRRRAGRRLRPAHRRARPQGAGHRPRCPGPRAADHPPGDVPPGPRLLPARRAPRDRLPGRVRRRVRGRAARAGAGAARDHRGGGADDVRRQLDRHRPDGADAGLPGPASAPGSRSGASRSCSSTSPSSTSAAARSAA